MTVGVYIVGPKQIKQIISFISDRTTLNVGFCIAAHKILISFPVWLKIQTPTWVLVSGIKAESTVWSDLQKCCSTAGVGVKWPDLLSRTAKSAPELTNLEAELTFLEAEPQRESVRTYKVGPTANTSGHGIYMTLHYIESVGIPLLMKTPTNCPSTLMKMELVQVRQGVL